jgi:hypothetical protein
MEALLIDDLAKALEALLNMPQYDETAETSRARLRIKNRAKKILKEYRDERLAKMQRLPQESSD